MASSRVERLVPTLRALRFQRYGCSSSPAYLPLYPPWICRHHALTSRNFTSSARRYEHRQQYSRESFSSRLRAAWRNTRVEWYPIPVGLGIGFLGSVQFYRVRQRRAREAEEEKEHAKGAAADAALGDGGKRVKPKKRKRIRPSGPWYAKLDEIRLHTRV